MNFGFGRDEIKSRLASFRRKVAQAGCDIAIVSSPENIFYLTGLEHWGYFAPHALLVPGEGELTLVTRFNEGPTVASQAPEVGFRGHGESETVAHVAGRLLAELDIAVCPPEDAGAAAARRRPRRIGIEKFSPAMTWGYGEIFASRLPDAEWHDLTDVVDGLRLVKSPAEQRCIRHAAAASTAGMSAALDALRAGASDSEVAAECQAAMIRHGSGFPGFGPFIRPDAFLAEEHTSWRGHRFAPGERVLLEHSACVRRYHAPMGRFVHLGAAPAGDREAAAICRDAYEAALGALRPGVPAREVYAAWQEVVTRAGLGHYRRHHCGYSIGIGFPPSWTGGNKVVGLRDGSDLELKEGMSFHLLSWLIGSGRGDFFLSDTVLLTAAGAEVLTEAPRDIIERG